MSSRSGWSCIAFLYRSICGPGYRVAERLWYAVEFALRADIVRVSWVVAAPALLCGLGVSSANHSGAWVSEGAGLVQ